MRRAEAWPIVAVLGIAVAGCGGGGTVSSTGAAGNPQTGAATNPQRTGSPARSTTAATTAATTTASSTTRASNPPKGRGARAGHPLGPGATVATVLRGRPTRLACGSVVTARYLRHAYGDAHGCTAAARAGGVARSVRIERIQPEGRYALVVAVPNGGPSDGERLAVSLVKGGGGWRVDSIHSNAPVGP